MAEFDFITDLESNDVLKAVGLPKSRRLPNLPVHVLAPLSAMHSKALQKTFTGDSEPVDTWITKYDYLRAY